MLAATTLMPDMHSRARTPALRDWLARIGLTALLVLSLVLPSPASADEVYEPPAPAPGSNAVGSCLAADQVWLYVVDGDDVLANQCVGTPASGEDALARGGMSIRFSSGRLICSLAGHPEQCPAAFAGSYWNYHHAGPGEKYTYSKEGAGTRPPEGGTIEAWCYNGQDEKSCTPPQLTIISGEQQILVPGVAAAEYVDPAPTLNEAVQAPPSTPWAFIGTGAVVAAGIVALLWWRRRSISDDAQVGGR